MVMVKEAAMSIPAVGAVRTSSAASIKVQIDQLRRQERQLTRQLTDLVSEGGTDESAGIKQQALEAQIVVIRMRIAQLEARRSEALAAAVSTALPSLTENGTRATSVARSSGASSAGGLDVEL